MAQNGNLLTFWNWFLRIPLEEVSFLEGIGISLPVPLRYKWSTWALRNFNVIPENKGGGGRGLLNSRRTTVRSLCLYTYMYVHVHLINMRCLCLHMALPRLVCGWALFNWLKRNYTLIWILRKLQSLSISWWMTDLSIVGIFLSMLFSCWRLYCICGVCLQCPAM